MAEGGRVAIVTGGASGIGRATAELLRAQGVAVAVFDRSGDDPVDITDVDAVAAAVERVRGELGPVDILVNAAGIATGGRLEDDGFIEAWERTMAVNLTGMMHVVRACIGDLLASGHGRIVNVASTEGLGASRVGSPYTASKHGVVGLTRSLAVEYGRRGLTTNCVCPGATLTGMTEIIPEEMRDTFARRNVPIGRYARPEEVAFMIVALTALEATYVNGAVIPVDGGLTISLG
jgi:3-oxoacyl-[acyl-carrier protein] reductase